MYLDEPVLIVREVDVAVGALWFQLLMVERMGHGALHRRVPSTQPYSVLRNARHRSSVRAEARERFGAGDVDSCGASAQTGRRSEHELHGGEALDDLHGSAAERTVPC